MTNNQLTAEQCFLRYAFPCAHVLLQQGRITKEQYAGLESAFYENRILPRDMLEQLFPAAFRRIKAMANGRDYWAVEIIREYFISYHNKCIDAGDGNYAAAPKEFREFCKVRLCTVLAKEGETLLVDMGGVKKRVIGKILPGAKVGDKVYVHQAVAVEIA